MEAVGNIAAIVDQARTRWLKNAEVLELLQSFSVVGLSVCQEPPVRPEGGQLFLFDRKVCRFFRRDGHNWRKKPDGKTIRETHEKLKVGQAEALNCYYAHADQDDGLQRRCYWQLDPDKEHIVLVHYLCTASSRAGGVTQRAPSTEQLLDGPSARPQRAVRASARRAYSPAPATRGGRRGGLAGAGGSSPHLASFSSGSLDSAELLGQDSDVAAQLAALPLVQGMSLPAATALPSLAEQYAAMQAHQAQQQYVAAQQQQQFDAVQPQAYAAVQQQYAAVAATAGGQALAQQQAALSPVLPVVLPAPLVVAPPGAVVTVAAVPSPAAAATVDLDSFGFGTDLSRPHPGVLYTGQRMASQLASQQSVASGPSPLPPLPGVRPLFQQESFSAEQHRALFREMSLGIQRESGEEGGYYLGSPTDRSLEPPLGADGKAGVAAAAGTPGGDLAALLASPPHAAHRRTVSRQGSGLSRLISKNWESELPMDIMLPDVDADISNYPVEGVVDIERPSSPSSRLVHHAGIAFFGSAATQGHTLEPSPLGTAGLPPLSGSRGAASPPRLFPFALGAERSCGSDTPTFGSSPAQLRFAAGQGEVMAARAPIERPSRLSGGVGMPRSGSHPHLAHLSRRSIAAPADPVAEEAEAAARRHERVEAAAVAAQEHRGEALAAARHRRAANSSEEAEEGLVMIDVPENMQRLTSFLPRDRQATAGREAVAAMAAEALELEARSLFKHMSIDEADAMAAVAAVKELEVMPTIPASISSDLDALSGHSAPGSLLSDGAVLSAERSVGSLQDVLRQER